MSKEKKRDGERFDQTNRVRVRRRGQEKRDDGNRGRGKQCDRVRARVSKGGKRETVTSEEDTNRVTGGE